MRRLPLCLVALTTALVLGPACARSSLYRDGDLSLSLRLSRDIADFQFQDTLRAVDTRYNRAALDLWSHELDLVELGITGGVGQLTQDGDPATEGRAFTGNSAGLLLRSRWAATASAGIEARGEAIYHDLSDDDTDFEWLDAYARLGPYARIAAWRVGGGVTAGLTRGERRRPGETRDFRGEQAIGGYALLAIRTRRRGEVSASLEAGPREQLTVRFSARF